MSFAIFTLSFSPRPAKVHQLKTVAHIDVVGYFKQFGERNLNAHKFLVLLPYGPPHDRSKNFSLFSNGGQTNRNRERKIELSPFSSSSTIVMHTKYLCLYVTKCNLVHRSRRCHPYRTHTQQVPMAASILVGFCTIKCTICIFPFSGHCL